MAFVETSTPPISNFINYQQLIELYDTDPETVLNRLTPTFLRTSPPLLDNLQTSFTERNMQDFSAHAHQLRGNAAVIAAERLQALSQRVEELARQKEWGQIDIWFPALTHEAGQVLAALRSRTDML